VIPLVPHDPEGYAVESDGRVHRRYPPHPLPASRRTRSVTGVLVLLRTAEAIVCRRCWPGYRKPRKRP
jgi:hypothetical protein